MAAFDENWVVLCQALHQSIAQEEWTDMHESLKTVCKKIGVKNIEKSIAGLGMVAW